MYYISSFHTIIVSTKSYIAFIITRITTFPKSFGNLVSEAHNLTHSYQNEVTKWRTHQYDNKTMISITNSYLPKYENLVGHSKALQPPKQFQNGTDLYTKSLESELQSYIHFKNYLSTNNSAENELSSKFLSDSFKDEIDSFKTLKSSGPFTFIPIQKWHLYLLVPCACDQIIGIIKQAFIALLFL